MSPVPANSFVLFPMGKKRFALPADSVAELARPDKLQTFPHTTPLMIGVLVRRGHLIPVCDVAGVLVGPKAPARKFYLIANRAFCDVPGQSKNTVEWTAVPVTGECELVSARLLPPTGRFPEYVIGMLQVLGEIIEVVDLEKLISDHASAIPTREKPLWEVRA
jgi:chemotaxis signal transduction protein